MVKLHLAPDDRVSSGQFVRAWFSGPEVRKLRIPVSSISLFGQMERVFVIVEARAQLRLVRTGAHSNGFVDVLSGLDAGERIVSVPTAALRDGQPVEVQP